MLNEYPTVLSTKEVMNILQIDSNKVYKLLNSGEIKCPRLDRKFIISKIAIQHYILKTQQK